MSHISNRLADGRIISASVQPRADGGWVVTHEDITEREALNAQLAHQNELLKQREEELETQNTRFDAAINNMSQGMCLFDAEQRVVFANRRFAEIYGLDPEQVKPGTTLRQILEARVAKGRLQQHRGRASSSPTALPAFSQEHPQIVHLARRALHLRPAPADAGWRRWSARTRTSPSARSSTLGSQQNESSSASCACRTCSSTPP